MEKLTFVLRSDSAPCRSCRPVLCGVVSSGNLEVLAEPYGSKDECRFELNTTTNGFGDIWEAVFRDFAERQSAGGLCFSINDAGAAPDIVGLRLDQAIDLQLQQIWKYPSLSLHHNSRLKLNRKK